MPDEPSHDALRRQLRFSLFLQAFAALMLTIALVVRVTSSGFDLLTAILVIAVLVVVAVTAYTLRRLADLRDS